MTIYFLEFLQVLYPVSESSTYLGSQSESIFFHLRVFDVSEGVCRVGGHLSDPAV